MLSHEEHIHLAWEILAGAELFEALATLRARLRRCAAEAGRPEIYHETVTAFLALTINERRHAGPANESFVAFRARNPDLFEDARGVLARAYSPERLAVARSRFLLPDRGAKTLNS